MTDHYGPYRVGIRAGLDVDEKLGIFRPIDLYVVENRWGRAVQFTTTRNRREAEAWCERRNTDHSHPGCAGVCMGEPSPDDPSTVTCPDCLELLL